MRAEQRRVGGTGGSGHDLNNPWVASVMEYNGYTNDFQHNIDNTTLFIGGGSDTGERAIADYFDDAIMTHVPFVSVVQNGELTQFNQNSNAESTDAAAVALMNATLFGLVMKVSAFMTPSAMPPVAPPAGPATIATLCGDSIATTIVVNGHTWTAGPNGQFQTTSNLEMEWRTDYQTMLAGNGASLTATQRMKGNAEAVFENAKINNMWQGAARETAYRADAQREIDAISGAMKINQASYGTDPNASLIEASYLQLGTTPRGNVALEEPAPQGHGVQAPPQVTYRGSYGDFMAGAD